MEQGVTSNTLTTIIETISTLQAANERRKASFPGFQGEQQREHWCCSRIGGVTNDLKVFCCEISIKLYSKNENRLLMLYVSAKTAGEFIKHHLA